MQVPVLKQVGWIRRVQNHVAYQPEVADHIDERLVGFTSPLVDDGRRQVQIESIVQAVARHNHP